MRQNVYIVLSVVISDANHTPSAHNNLILNTLGIYGQHLYSSEHRKESRGPNLKFSGHPKVSRAQKIIPTNKNGRKKIMMSQIILFSLQSNNEPMVGIETTNNVRVHIPVNLSSGNTILCILR